MRNRHFVYIDNKRCGYEEEESILQIALRNNIDIPHFCYDEDLGTDANCRACLVEIVKTKKIVTSCTLKAEPGLAVRTASAKVNLLRHENLELLLADHKVNCPKCQKNYFCKTAEDMKKYTVTGKKYKREHIDRPIHKLCTAAELDPNVCISCNKCVNMCEYIGIGFLKLEGKGSKKRISYIKDPNIDCIYCGQCTVHCPVNAAREQSHIEEVEKTLQNKENIVIAQMAPSVRVSIGEEFGQPIGKNLTRKMYTAFRRLGFDKVFDVNMGADITTMVEAKELTKRIKNKELLPMFTTCCPAWVKFVEFYYPEMIPHLTTARSPHIHSGVAYKTWWAKKQGIDPKKIKIVSFMPCTSKKYEAKNELLKINGLFPIDYVLTTRETAILLKKHNIDLPNLKSSEVDESGTYSGAGAIYGASGGVMESALRTASYLLSKEELRKIDYKEIRGIEGIKKADIMIGNYILKVAVVSMPKNARIILEEIKKNKRAYDYVEFMSCPGGCIGGGGQPIPSTQKIIKKRIEGLYNIDSSMKLRKAHLNPVVLDFFKYIDTLSPSKQREILHRKYTRKKKFE